MYKKILKNIKSDIHKKEEYIMDLWKNSEKNHAIHDKLPHFIFSAEKPKHPTDLNMSHEDIMRLLLKKGYNAEEIMGKYGENERAILVHKPSNKSFSHLNKLAASLGQESSIISDGYNHEMHYLNGPKSGRHHKGSSTIFHKETPDDFFSTLDDGTHFTHAFDYDTTHSKSDFIKDIAGSIKKSEKFMRNGEFFLKKSEEKRHKLDIAGPDTKLIHYSPKEGLEEINPEHHGVRRIGSEAKQGAPEHKMSFYYAEGVEPESVVMSGAKSKYVSSLGDKKLYDIAKDKDGLWTKAMENLKSRSQGTTMPYEKKPAFHQAIKDSGYHGIYNSGLEGNMGHAVGMFESMKPDSEHKIHRNDFKETSSIDHHDAEEGRNKAKEFSKENGNDGKFLHNLNSRFKG